MGWEFLYLALAEARGWDRLAPAGIKTSFYAELDGAYARDTAIRVGDTLSLWTDTVRVDAAAMRYETVHSEAAVRVGAIVCYFPDTGIFPAGGSARGCGWWRDRGCWPGFCPTPCALTVTARSGPLPAPPAPFTPTSTA